MVAPSLRALEADWFSSVLGCTIEAAVAEPLAFTGAVADMARFRLAGDGPATVVAKIRGTSETQLAIDAALGMYDREARFYSAVAEAVPLQTPRCFHVGDGNATPLLLEDLGDLRMGDQLEGLELTDAERLVDVLADMHARYWESPVLEEGWLSSPAEGAHAAMVARIVATGVGPLRERFDGRADPTILETISAWAPRWTEVLSAGAIGSLTLTHNNCRLDNLFFRADGEPVFVDWQIPARARGTQDVAQLLASGFRSEDLRAHWEPLLRRYHDRLGIADYSWEHCRHDYRQNVLYTLGAGLALVGSLAIDDDRGLGDVFVMRTLEHVADIAAFETLGDSS